MKQGSAKHPLWYQTLGFRFAVILAGTLVAFSLLLPPIYDFMLRLIGLEGATVIGTILSTVVAIATAVGLGFVLSRWFTGRLARLSRTAEQATGGELPGPFDDSGNDEIAVVASTMNVLRELAAERVKSFALRDIRKREWIAQVSHDLRTPLTAQLACLDRADLILQKSGSSENRNELRELIGVARLDAERVHAIADDLLEIARLDAGDTLRLEPVPPGELVRQSVRSLEPLAAQRGVRLEVSVTPHLPMLHADGRRLTRAIENLVRNAIQHARSSVHVMAIASGRAIRFEVRDDGRGLPRQPDFLDYLRRLSSEVRLAELAKRRSRGDSAGLGLVVAQRVADAHRGVVDAYDLSNGGAAFLMDIPLPSKDVSPSEDTSVAV